MSGQPVIRGKAIVIGLVGGVVLSIGVGTLAYRQGLEAGQEAAAADWLHANIASSTAAAARNLRWIEALRGERSYDQNQHLVELEASLDTATFDTALMVVNGDAALESKQAELWARVKAYRALRPSDLEAPEYVATFWADLP